MRHGDRWMAGVLIAVGLLLPACREAEEADEGGSGPATIETIDGSDLVRVVLTADAEERLDMQTSTVGGDRGSATVIPYAAVFYGPAGDTWTYTNPEPLTYVRAPITIDTIEGDDVVLSDGPPVGTAVVTQGAAELFGAETGVDA